jgi:hypothetical protein
MDFNGDTSHVGMTISNFYRAKEHRQRWLSIGSIHNAASFGSHSKEH